MREKKFYLGTLMILVSYYLMLNVIMSLGIFDAVSSNVYYMIFTGVILLIGISASWVLWGSERGSEIRHFRFRWSYLSALLLSLFLFFLWAKVSSTIFPRSQNSQVAMEVASELAGFAYINVRFLLTCLVGPISEELVFRGLVMTALERYKKFYLDVLVSSCLFSLIHVLQHGWVTTDFVLYFGMGIILGTLFRYTRSIYWPIAAHIIWNSFLVVVSILVFGY